MMTYLGPSTVPICVIQQTGLGEFKPASFLTHQNQTRSSYKISYSESRTATTDILSVIPHKVRIQPISSGTNLTVPNYVVGKRLLLYILSSF